MGPLTGVMQLVKPVDTVIVAILEQVNLLEAYKMKYGEL